MKCEIIIDPNCEEKVVIYAKELSPLVSNIQRLTGENAVILTGYVDKEFITLNLSDVFCITVLHNKTYAVCEKENVQLKERLYVLEEKLPDHFIKINQSCIANLQKIDRFDASISGTLKLRFQNGYIDYVSRRQLKKVKETIGMTR